MRGIFIPKQQKIASQSRSEAMPGFFFYDRESFVRYKETAKISEESLVQMIERNHVSVPWYVNIIFRERFHRGG